MSGDYINFSDISGSSGYGFRDNAGTIEFKHSGGSWAAIGTGGGVGTGSVTTVKEAGVQLGGADIVVLDFGAGFDLTESPDTEINLSLDLSEVLSGSEISMSGNVLTIAAGIARDSEVAAGYQPLATGTPTGSKFLRDDNSWQSIPGGGDALVANPLTQFSGITTTNAEFNFVAGVTSAIQGQINGKQASDPDLTIWAGVTPGTGVATALAISVGTAGAFVVNGGALGTPSSGVATNLTGTATGLTAGNATLAATSTVVDGTDSTSFPAIFDSATGSLAIKTDGALLYDANNGTLAATIFSGAGGGLTLNAAGFNGNLATTDNTLQEVAQALDDLTAGGGGTIASTAQPLKGDRAGNAVAMVSGTDYIAVTGTPTTGDVPTATSSTTAAWAAPTGGSGSAVETPFHRPIARSQQPSGLLAEVALPGAPVEVADDSDYNAFPTLIVDRFGRLQCYYRNATTHTSSDGVIKRAVSARGGTGWVTSTVSGPTVVQDLHAATLPSGRIILVYSKTTAASDVFLLYSDDDGTTFSAETEIASSTTWDGTAGVIVTDLYVTPKGALLMLLYGHYNAGNTYRTMAMRSTDGGTTWGTEVALAGTGSTTDLVEPRIIRGSNLTALIRDETNADLLRSTSTDDGLTWSATSDVTPPNYSVSQVDAITVGGITQMFYRGDSASNVRRAVSYDGAATWATSEEVLNLAIGTGYMYSDSVVDGNLIVTAFAVDTDGTSTAAEIRLKTYRVGSTFNLDDSLTAGTIQAATAYKSTDGTSGATATTGGAVFKDGLYTSGTITGGSASPGGSDTHVQFNDGGSTFGGDAGFTYNKTANTFATAGSTGPSKIIGSAASGGPVGLDMINAATDGVTRMLLGQDAAFAENTYAGFYWNGSTVTETNLLTIPRSFTVDSSGDRGLVIVAHDSAGDIIFGTGGYATGNRRMTIFDDGGVSLGTGTTSPGAGVLTAPTIQATASVTLAENASIALDPNGSADGKYSGTTMTGTAGYTQAFGDLVYLDPTDSRWEACDANSAAAADGDSRGIIGIVVVAGTDGTACTILLQGIIRADAKFPTFTVNGPVYVSETAGSSTQTQPVTTDVVIRVVGYAITADEMYFCPANMWITHT